MNTIHYSFKASQSGIGFLSSINRNSTVLRFRHFVQWIASEHLRFAPFRCGGKCDYDSCTILKEITWEGAQNLTPKAVRTATIPNWIIKTWSHICVSECLWYPNLVPRLQHRSAKNQTSLLSKKTPPASSPQKRKTTTTLPHSQVRWSPSPMLPRHVMERCIHQVQPLQHRQNVSHLSKLPLERLFIVFCAKWIYHLIILDIEKPHKSFECSRF